MFIKIVTEMILWQSKMHFIAIENAFNRNRISLKKMIIAIDEQIISFYLFIRFTLVYDIR